MPYGVTAGTEGGVPVSCGSLRTMPRNALIASRVTRVRTCKRLPGTPRRGGEASWDCRSDMDRDMDSEGYAAQGCVFHVPHGEDSAHGGKRIPGYEPVSFCSGDSAGIAGEWLTTVVLPSDRIVRDLLPIVDC